MGIDQHRQHAARLVVLDEPHAPHVGSEVVDVRDASRTRPAASTSERSSRRLSTSMRKADAVRSGRLDIHGAKVECPGREVARTRWPPMKPPAPVITICLLGMKPPTDVASWKWPMAGCHLRDEQPCGIGELAITLARGGSAGRSGPRGAGAIAEPPRNATPHRALPRALRVDLRLSLLARCGRRCKRRGATVHASRVTAGGPARAATVRLEIGQGVVGQYRRDPGLPDAVEGARAPRLARS